LRIHGDRFTEDITHTTGWSGAAGYYDGRIKTTSFTFNWAGKPADYAVQYTYDDVGQLTSADNNLNNAWDIGIGNTISYDANGNILDLRRGSTTKNYAYYVGTNKVQNTDGSGNDYVYDSNANVNSSSPKSINNITYDSFTQRPISVSMSSGASLTLEYGGGTQRVLKNYTSGGSTNSRLYLHGANDYPLIEKNKTTATAETLAVYIYGINGAVAKRIGSTVLFLLKDHLGSTRVVMDPTGLVRTYYDYDALGNLIRMGTTNEVKYQFTGQEYDENGLHNYRARLYDSDLGKFYAVDPEGEFAGSFLYAGNNPISYTDPTGEFISLVAFAYYAYQTYQYASYAYTAYSLFQATRQGGFSGFVQAAITMGAGAVVGGRVSSLIGGNSLGGSILSGTVGGAAGGAASSYVMGSNVGTSSLYSLRVSFGVKM
jgi:RHS repeat-associated protein